MSVSSVGCRHPNVTAYPCSALQASGFHARPHPSREIERARLLQQPHSPSRTRHHSHKYLGCKQTLPISLTQMPTWLVNSIAPWDFFFWRTPWEISLFRDQHGLNHMVNGVFVKDSCPSRHAPAHLSLINLCSLDQADAFSTTHKPKQRASHNIPKSETFSLCSDRTPNNDPSPLTALLSLDRTVNRKNTVPPPPPNI